MKIYAVRDRLLDYFQRPMAMPNVKDLLTALAREINDPETKHEIAQAPDHFEIWEIGEVDEQGHLIANRQLICNCHTLIRAGVWKRRTEGATEPEGHAADHHGQARRPEGRTSATSTLVSDTPPRPPGAARTVRKGPDSSHQSDEGSLRD